jgi:hypothetical protein
MLIRTRRAVMTAVFTGKPFPAQWKKKAGDD